ncbi:hypothetical protein YB2330_002050 [Saitoella coloradoensis]
MSLAAKRKLSELLNSLDSPSPASTPRKVAPISSKEGTPIPKKAAKPGSLYAPYSRELFLERLGMFRPAVWSFKPSSIDEVAWAKRGWICSGTQKDKVECGVCSQTLLVLAQAQGDVDEEVREATEKALEEKYAEMIVTAHKETCPWRKRGCDETIFRLPLSDPQTAREAFDSRVESLLPHSETLSLSIDMKTGSLSPDTLPTLLRKPTVPPPILALALFGWSAISTNPNDTATATLTCATCHRRRGLWNLKAGDELDLVDEHREYCPWISVASQAGPVAGWEQLLRMMEKKTPKEREARRQSGQGTEVSQVEVEDGHRDSPEEDPVTRLRKLRARLGL